MASSVRIPSVGLGIICPECLGMTAPALDMREEPEVWVIPEQCSRCSKPFHDREKLGDAIQALFSAFKTLEEVDLIMRRRLDHRRIDR